MVPSSNDQFLLTPSVKTEFIHNFMNTLKLSNFFNDTIENKKFEWLLDVENTCEFVKWICNYIGPENILRDEEINEYLELTAEGIPDVSFLNGSQLHDEVSSSVVKVTDASVFLIEEEISDLDTLVAVITKQQETLRPKYKSLQDDVLQQCERRNKVQQQVQEAAKVCNEASQKLDVACAKFIECILPLNNIVNNYHTDQKVENLGLLSQMPYKDFRAKCDRAAQNIDIVRSQNRLEEDIEMSSRINDQSVQGISGKNKTGLCITLQKIAFCKEVAIEAKSKLAIASLERLEYLAGIDLLSNLSADIKADLFNPSQNKLRSQLADAEEKIEDLQQVSPVSELGSELQRLMNAHETHTLHKLVREAKPHRDNNLECRKMMLSCVEAGDCQWHLFFILLVEEKHKLNFIANLLQDYTESLNGEFQQLTERIERMKMKSRPQDGKELCKSSSLERMLESWGPTQTSLEDGQLLEAFKSLDERIHSDEETLFHSSFTLMEETLTKNFQSLQAMAKLLFSGPANKPVIVDTDLSSQLYGMRHFISKLRQRLYQLVPEWELVKTNQLSNKYYRNRRLLWVHFLTDYGKINNLIADMEHAISEQENRHA